MDARLSYRTPDADTLASYARAHQVDLEAPIQAAAEVVIDAPIAQVWQLLTDVTGWADSLERGLSKVELPQGIRVGAPFRRTNKGFTMTARFEVVETERELAWTGVALGVRAVHRFQMESIGGGRTRLWSAESLGGRPLAILYSSAKLQSQMESSLASFRAACER